MALKPQIILCALSEQTKQFKQLTSVACAAMPAVSGHRKAVGAELDHCRLLWFITYGLSM